MCPVQTVTCLSGRSLQINHLQGMAPPEPVWIRTQHKCPGSDGKSLNAGTCAACLSSVTGAGRCSGWSGEFACRGGFQGNLLVDATQPEELREPVAERMPRRSSLHALFPKSRPDVPPRPKALIQEETAFADRLGRQSPKTGVWRARTFPHSVGGTMKGSRQRGQTDNLKNPGWELQIANVSCRRFTICNVAFHSAISARLTDAFEGHTIRSPVHKTDGSVTERGHEPTRLFVQAVH